MHVDEVDGAEVAAGTDPNDAGDFPEPVAVPLLPWLGQAALMAVLGLALGSYVVSGIWSRQVLGGLSIRVHRPVEVFAGRPTVLEVDLENRRRFFPAYGVVVRDDDGLEVARAGAISFSSSRYDPVPWWAVGHEHIGLRKKNMTPAGSRDRINWQGITA